MVGFTKLQGMFWYPVGSNMAQNIPIIKRLAQCLLLSINEDTPINLWCRGSSGVIIASILSLSFTDVLINHVKKPGEDSHSFGVNTYAKKRVNIIVDDFITSGRTINAIYEKMKNCDMEIVDFLCVGDDVFLNNLNFTPLYIISGAVYENGTKIYS